MKLYLAAILLLLLWDDVLGLVGKGHSDDLSRALGVIRRRRRWLESGIQEGGHHSRPHHVSKAAYGTVTHFPDVRKRPFLDPETAASLVPPPPPPGPIFRERFQEKWEDPAEDSSDEDKKKKMKRLPLKKKKSLFRERQHSIEDEERKKRAMVLKKRAKKTGMTNWESDTDAELQRMAERRFLEAILNGYRNEEADDDAHFDTSAEVFGELSDNDVRRLVSELKNRLAQEYAMEDEGERPEDAEREPLPEEEEEENEDLRKRGAVWKRYLWQDGMRYALGDHPTKRNRDERWQEPYDLRMLRHRKQPLWSPEDEEEEIIVDDDGDMDSQVSPKDLARFRAFLEQLQRGDDGDEELEERKRKREPDPWFPAFDVKRYVQAPWNNYPMHAIGREEEMERKRRLPLKRKRSSFRERVTHDPGVAQYVGVARKRFIPSKRSSENEEKRVVKKSVTEEPPKKVVEGVAMKELQNILADDPKEAAKKSVAKREDKDGNGKAFSMNTSQTASPSHEHEMHSKSINEEGESDDNDLSDEAFSEESIDDYFGYDKRDVSRKRKRQSWDDYLGIDKRLIRRSHSHPNHHIEPLPHPQHLEKEASKMATAKTEAADTINPTKASQDAPASATQATVGELPPSTLNESLLLLEGNSSGHPTHQKFSEWVMNRYFRSMAAAMSSKRKRTPDLEYAGEDEGSGAHPLAAMDRKLEAIEDLMLEEALDLVEDGGAGDGEDQREKIMHRLDAAHSLEKMREALAQFEGSLDKIRTDEKHRGTKEEEEEWEEEEEKKKKKMKKAEKDEEENDEDDKKKKKKSMEKKQETKKRPSGDVSIEEELDVDADAACPVFDEIVGLCDELSKTYGDEQRALIDACSRHIMCYACDYVYNERDSLPCSLIFMREAHEICQDVYCGSAAGQIHGALRQRAPQIQRATAPMCLSDACVRAYRRR